MKRNLPLFLNLLLGSLILLLYSCKDKSGVEGPYRQAGEYGRVTTEKVDPSLFRKQRKKQETMEGAIIRGNIDLSRTTVAYYSAKPAVEETREPLKPEDTPLEIVDYGPVGELPIENRRPTIYVMFNHPLVPLAKLGEPTRSTPYMTIEPAVPGTYRWYGTRALSFEPDEALIEHPRYRVRISKDAASLGGRKLGSDFEFSIHSEAVKIVNSYPGREADVAYGSYDIPTDIARYMILEFNQQVEPDHIKDYISVFFGPYQERFSVSRPEYPDRLQSRRPRGLLLSFKEEPPESTRIRVILKDGATPQEGFPPRSGDQSIQLKTLYIFEVREIFASSYGFPRNNKPGTYPVYLSFSHPVGEEVPLEQLKVAVNGIGVTAAAVQSFHDSIRFSLENINPEDEVAVTVPDTILDVHKRKLSNPGVFSVVIPKPRPFISFPGHGFKHLESQFPPRIIWESRNVKSGSIGYKSISYDGFPNYYGNLADIRESAPPAIPFEASRFRENRVHYHLLDFSDLMNPRNHGTVFLNWEMTLDPSFFSRASYAEREGSMAIQVTDLGISTRYGYNKILVWVNSLSTGEPVENAAVTVFNLIGAKFQAVTNREGLAVIPFAPEEFVFSFIPHREKGSRWVHIRVEKEGDLAEMRASDTHNAWRFNVIGVRPITEAEEAVHRVFLFTDRGLYKPGEEIAFRGIHWMQNPDGFEPYEGYFTVSLYDYEKRKTFWKETAYCSASGGMAYRTRLPEDLEPGRYQIRYEADDNEVRKDFTVSHFRRLAFQVKTKVPDRIFHAGDSISAEIEASYLAGGAMPGAGYRYFWTRRPVSYTPPGTVWKNWAFGPVSWESEQTLSDGEGNLSGSGKAQVSEKTTTSLTEGFTYDYIVETTVTDVDRQEIGSSARVRVHPAAYYIGARFKSGSEDGWWSRFVPTNSTVKAEAALVSPDGRTVKDNISGTVTLIKGSWKSTKQQGVYGRINTRWEYVKEEIAKEKTVFTDGLMPYTFKITEPGNYTLKFEATDPAGRKAVTDLTFYGTGSGWVKIASQTPSDINMIVDKSIYEPGDTARILVQSPVPEGRYLLTIERENIREERLIELEGSQELIEIPIKEEYLPVFYVALTGFTSRTEIQEDYFEPDLGRPRSLFGITRVNVSTKAVELDVEILPLKGSYKPGEEAEIDIRVSKNGEPVPYAEITALAVDRGILDLIDYHVPNPLFYFYNPAHFPLCVAGDDSRRLLIRPVTYDIKNLQGGDSSKLQERKDFNPLALFEPFIRADEKGLAKVTFTLPDSLTTYRITALALDKNRLGFQEDELYVRNPINVRTALPRRFRNRDTAAAGVVVTNLTRENQEIRVAVESDILDIAGEREKKISVPAGGVYELPFLLVGEEEGKGSIKFTIRSGPVNEVLIENIVVERPLVIEAFTTIGSVSGNSGEPRSFQEGIILPSRVGPGFGGLTLIADSSIRPYIEDSLHRLRSISPPASLTSRLLRTAGNIFSGTIDEIDRGTLSKLKARQFGNGGIGYRMPHQSWAAPSWFLSLLTAQVLRNARDSNMDLPDAPEFSGLLDFLQESLKEARGKKNSGFLSVWTAAILVQEERIIAADIAFLKDAEDKLGIAGYNLLAETFLALNDRSTAADLYQRSKNFMSLGTQTIDIKQTYERSSYFSTMESELALFLRTAVLLNEPFDLLQRIAGTLNMSRTARRFHSTFQDMWILYGFTPLLNREKGGTTDFNSSVAIGKSEIWTHRFAGASSGAEKARFSLFTEPLQTIEKDALLPLTVNKSGAGDLYYTTILEYALPGETATPRDEGISVFSQVETLDGKIIEGNDLPLGETLRMRVMLSSSKRRSHLNLNVPIPSGAEIVDPSFVTSGTYRNRGGVQEESWTRETVYGDNLTIVGDGYAEWDEGAWYFWAYTPSQQIYDNAIVYSWEDFYAGQREVSFLFKTTTPGIYPTPPVQAKLELEPEVFGRNGGRLFVINPE